MSKNESADGDNLAAAICFVLSKSRKTIRDVGHWTKLPGVSAQLQLIQSAERATGYSDVRVHVGRRRRHVKSLLADSTFVKALEETRHMNARLYVADIFQLLEGMPIAQATAELEKLDASKVPIFSSRQFCLLSEISGPKRAFELAAGWTKYMERSASVRKGLKNKPRSGASYARKHLPRARKIAEIVAANKADRTALEIGPIIEEIQAKLPDHKRNSNSAIMRALNALGRLSPRGKTWSDVQVGRIRQRYAKLKATEKTVATASDDIGTVPSNQG